MAKKGTAFGGMALILKEFLDRHLPFAAYRLPDEKEIYHLFQSSPRLTFLQPDEKISGLNGFVFSPFVNSSMPRLMIRGDHVLTEDIPVKVLGEILIRVGFSDNGYYRPSPYEATKKEFCSGVKSIISEIKKGTVNKAVLSRVHLQSVKKSFSAIATFEKLLAMYPSAMVYMAYLPHIGFWMGATPELLLETEKDELTTVSLAGTKKEQDVIGVKWGLKELMEQKMVTDHIKTCLDKYFDDFQLDGPNTVQAGPVSHLKTSFRVKSNSRHIHQVFDDLLKDLHPTPAVGGMPKDAALKLISKIEKHDRAYYSGFIGPVNIHNKTRLFINLRCMEVLHQYLSIYVGAGITSDSIPEDEWEETQIKAQTLLNAL